MVMIEAYSDVHRKAREKTKGTFLVSNTSKVGKARKILGGRLEQVL